MSDILSDLDQFIRIVDKLDPVGAERQIVSILERMLAEEGYSMPVWAETRGPDIGYDLHMTRHQDDGDSDSLAIEFKKVRRPVDSRAIYELVGRSQFMPVNRFMFISTAGFTQHARRLVQDSHPVDFQLFDLGDLRSMAEGLTMPSFSRESRVLTFLKDVSGRLARFVAEDPRELDNLEWREFEKMMAVVFENLGFDAELTPASKDGGKDIILRLPDVAGGGSRTYYIELKHWRSGKRVGQGVVKDFVELVAREVRDGGLILATNGFASDAFGFMTEVERRRVAHGGKEKVISFCRAYARARAGLWNPVGLDLPEFLLGDA